MGELNEVGVLFWDLESSSLKSSPPKLSWLAWICKVASDFSEVGPPEHGLSPMMDACEFNIVQ